MRIIYKSILDNKTHYEEKSSLELSKLDLNHKYFKFCPSINKFYFFDDEQSFLDAFKADEGKIYCFFVKDLVNNCFRECQKIEHTKLAPHNKYNSIQPKIEGHDYYDFDFSEYTLEFKE